MGHPSIMEGWGSPGKLKPAGGVGERLKPAVLKN
jgi:hypothetical protein